jgi:hypothetical protein
MKPQGVKDVFAAPESVGERHREEAMTSLRSKRKDKINDVRKRRAGTFPSANKEVDIVTKINTLNLQQFMTNGEPCLAQLQILHDILLYDNSDAYFGPSNLFYEQREGPFILAHESVLPRLVSLLTIPDCTALVARCLANISHGRENAWCRRLMELKVPQIALNLLDSPVIGPEVRGCLLCTLGNLMDERDKQFRHFITSMPRFYAILARQFGACDLADYLHAFRTSIGRYNGDSEDIPFPLQPVETLRGAWTPIADMFLQTVEADPLLLDVIDAMMHRKPAEYVKFTLHTPGLMQHVFKIGAQPRLSLSCVKSLCLILLAASKSIEDRPQLIFMGIIRAFMALIFHQETVVRIDAANGLAYMAECPQSVPIIGEQISTILTTIVESTDLYSVCCSLRIVVAQLIITGLTSPEYRAYTVEKLVVPCMGELTSVLQILGKPGLIVLALDALKLSIECGAKRYFLQSDSGVEGLQQLATNHPNPEISDRAEALLTLLGE